MKSTVTDFEDRVFAAGDLGWTQRTRQLLGDGPCDVLREARVLVVGQGGVGSYCSEFLARAGIGRITIVDGDIVEPSNRNRQLCALVGTEGRRKVDVMRERLQSINPEIQVATIAEFVKPGGMNLLLSAPYDYVVDAIDSLAPKVYLLSEARTRNLPIVSSMGAGGRMDPSLIRIADISATQRCRLARYVRKRLQKTGIRDGITAVYSLEAIDDDALLFTDGADFKKSSFGTVSYMPAAFGAACASVVVTGIVSR